MATADQHYLPPAPLGAPEDSVAWAEWYRKLREVAESGQQSLDNLDSIVYPALNDKLNKNAADILGGTITFSSLGAFKVGSVTWNGSTVTGTGLLFNQYGIVGALSGSPKFTLKVDGTAVFAGELSAATGTFSGTVQAGSFITGTSGRRLTINSGGDNQLVTYDNAGNLNCEIGGTSNGVVFTHGGSDVAVYADNTSSSYTVPTGFFRNYGSGAAVYGNSASGYGGYFYGSPGLYANTIECGTMTGNVIGVLFDSNGYNWIQPNTTQGGTPTNSAAPVAWLKLNMNSTAYYVPLFQ